MATISTSIKLVDGMSPALRAANTSLKMLIRTWDAAKIKFSQGLGGKGGIININADLGNVVNKLSAIESGISRVNQNIRKTHSGIGHIVNQGVHANSTLSKMSVQSRILNQTVKNGNNEVRLLNDTLGNGKLKINANITAQERYNRSIQRGDSFMRSLYYKVRNITMLYGGVQAGMKVLNTADELTRTEARLNLMTGGDKQATAALQESTYQAAQRSRSDYLGTASTVAKLGQRAPGLFKSNDDTVKFVENLNKAYKIAGATEQEMWASTLQLSQGLGAGALRGEEFRSVFEAAPNLIRIIAEEMGVPVGKMKDLAAEGELTSEVIRDALLNATDKINADFANIPYTWADVWTTMSNTTLRAAQPIFKMISKITSSERFIKFAAGVERAIKWAINMFLSLWYAVKPTLLDIYDGLEVVYNFFADKWDLISAIVRGSITVISAFAQKVVNFVVPILKGAFTVIENIYNFFKNNWSLIAPIVFGIAGAFLAYKGALMLVATWTAITSAAIAIKNGVLVVAKVVMGLFTGATWAQVAAQMSLNTAILTCPIFWIVVGVIALIAVVYGVVAAYNKWTDSTVSATGIVFGAFSYLYASIYNLGVNLWNNIASFVEFFANVWTEPVYSIKKLFVNLAVNFLENCISMTKGWDKFATSIANAFISAVNIVIDGWNWLIDTLGEDMADKIGIGKQTKFEARASITSDLENARDKLEASLGVKPDGYWEAPKLEYKNVGETVTNAYKYGEKLASKLEDFKLSDITDKIEEFAKKYGDYNKTPLGGTEVEDLLGGNDDGKKAADKTNKLLGDINKGVDGIGNSLDVSDDEKNYIQRIAERERINQLARQEINVQMTNNNSVKNEADVVKLIKEMARQLAGEIKSSTEGLAY